MLLLLLLIVSIKNEDKIMPACDGKLFKKFKRGSAFVETGAYLGEGVQAALRAGFDKIWTVELSESQYKHVAKKFCDNEKVVCLFGDSRDLLGEMLLKCRDMDPLIWLDAHGGQSNTGDITMQDMIPLECGIINNVMEKRSFTILIDDFGYSNDKTVLEENWIVKEVRRIWPDAIITREDGCGDHRGGYRTMPGFVLAVRVENKI